MDVAVIGAGRVGTALAVLLQRAGHRIVGVWGRDASRERAATYLPDVPFVDPPEAARAAELVLVTVPDGAIERVTFDLASAGAFRPGQFVAHTSGAEPLSTLRAHPAIPLVLHPLQTFPDVEFALAHVPGSALAVTAQDAAGDELGERLAADLHMRAFRLSDRHRAAYHAAAVFASNDVVTVLAAAARLFEAAGVEDPIPLFLPLTRAAVDAVEQLGPEAALTGPVVRGDVDTVRSHLGAVMRPGLGDVYLSLALAALELADRAGRVDPPARDAMREELLRWRESLDEESHRWR